MKIKNCSKCNTTPLQQSDELGITYRLICTTCGKCTGDIISQTSTIADPHLDNDTLSRLVSEWNSMN